MAARELVLYRAMKMAIGTWCPWGKDRWVATKKFHNLHNENKDYLIYKINQEP